MKYSPTVNNSRAVALGLVGTSVKPGWCLQIMRTKIFRVPGVGDYDRDGSADAEDFWKAAAARGKVVRTSDPQKIPAGVMIAWTDPSRPDHGHVAYSLGAGMMVSTDLPTSGKIGRCPIDLARQRWGHRLEGYIITDANGYTYVRGSGTPATPSKPPAKPEKLPTVSAANMVKAARHGINARPSEEVKRVQNALNQRANARVGLSGIWDRATRNAYGAWQRTRGYRGVDADGIPGRKTLTELGDGRFTVTP